ncbi:MAG: hypothetical protein ABW252_14685 [Polyangiales bacterium]
MARERLAAKSLLLSLFMLGVGCADAEPTFNDGTESEEVASASASSETESPKILAQSTGCCSDGDCVCRGEEPNARTPMGRGPYGFRSYSSGFARNLSWGGGTIYYPTNAEPPFSGVVMCPGFTALKSSIADWGPFFASHGIVLMVIDTTTVLDQVVQRAQGLKDALKSLRAENNRLGSPLNGKMSPNRYGLSGWSMGGGGTWIASADMPELKTAVTLAGHNLTAGGSLGSIGSRVPTLMMNGATDVTILGGLGQSESAYNTIPNGTPKLLYVMALDGHFSWGTPTTNGGNSGKYMLAWQKTFLEGDQRYRKFLKERGPLATVWMSNIR